MSFTAILGVISGIFKFWDQVVWLVKTLEKTPAEKQADFIAALHNASVKADETSGDTSGYERIIGRRKRR